MILNIFLLVLVALLVLSVLILSHELGHFLMAKAAGVWVEEFGLGLPPRIWGKKIGETLYSINVFPVGGFVRLHGETSGEEIKKPGRAFTNKSKKARAAIALGGVIGNFVLAVLVFAIFYSFTGFPRETGKVNVVEVATGSPAEVAGIIPGDTIKAVDDQEITANQEFIKLVDEKKGKRVVVSLEDREVTLTPREEPPPDEGAIGVVITSQEIYYPPLWQRPFLGVVRGVEDSVIWSGRVFFGLGTVASDVSRGETPKGVVGPFGIVLLITQVTKMGILPLLNFVGIFAVNLAIINLLPIPPFDGSRLAIIGVEAVTRRKVAEKIESKIHLIGLVIVIVLFILMTWREAVILVTQKSISGFIEAVVK